jgi:ribosome assembly protein 1
MESIPSFWAAHCVCILTDRPRLSLFVLILQGKTTLSDQLVSSNGIISSRQAGKLRYLDSTEDEQIRGITMRSSAISLLYDLPQGGGAARKEPGSYLINLIDSPGHIDFSSDVSTATRLCDCGLVVVDVLEGVCPQTHAVLRQAWREKMRPLLVLNKVDRLVSELQLTPLDAWHHLTRVVENVNALTASLVAAESMAAEDGDNTTAEYTAAEDRWTFRPEEGEVVFASALDGWGFTLGHFARMWAKRLEAKPGAVRRMLWGPFVYSKAKRKVVKWTPTGSGLPMFASMILEPIWQVYGATMGEAKDPVEAARIATFLDLEVPEREMRSAEPRVALQSILKRWLPLSDAVLRCVVELGPSPAEAQAERIEVLWPSADRVEDEEEEEEEGTGEEGRQDQLPAGGENATGEDRSPMSAAQEAVRMALACCDTSSSSPVVVFVSKMVPVARREVVGVDGRPLSSLPWADEGRKGPNGEEREVLVAFGRVLCGTLTPATELHLLARNHGRGCVTPVSQSEEPRSGLALFMMMGAGLAPLASVPAGNVVGIVGLEGIIAKSATLSSNLSCPALRAISLQARPIVRVAVEPVNQSDLGNLEAGLSRLFQADPAVEVSVSDRGEHIVCCLGELHLEQCIKDLRERYAGVEVRVSPPLVTFRETVLCPCEPGQPPPGQMSMPPWADEEGLSCAEYRTGTARISTPGGHVTLTLRCIPLIQEAARLLDRSRASVKHILDVAGEDVDNGHHPRSRKLVRHYSRLVPEEQGTTEESLPALDRVLSFGPRHSGPNVLAWSSNLSVEVISEEEGVGEEVDGEVRERIMHMMRNGLITGFQLASGQGPLAGEEMYGVCLQIERVEVRQGCLQDESSDGTHQQFGPLSGQIISAVKTACRAAFLCCPVRLVEAYFKCALQCDQTQLGNMYAVMSRRRGQVVGEDLVEGTQLFLLDVLVPVVESFGLATELLKRTSGAATAPQLTFSHWEQVGIDPFWRPQTEEEREDEGEGGHLSVANVARKYVDQIRKRKGMATAQKIVIAAEKQRNLSVKK